MTVIPVLIEMSSLLLDEHLNFGEQSRSSLEPCDPQLTVGQLLGDVLKDYRSKHALIQLLKLATLMAVAPWLLWQVKDRFDWDVDMWAKASLFGVNVVIAAYVLLAWREDQTETSEKTKEE